MFIEISKGASRKYFVPNYNRNTILVEWVRMNIRKASNNLLQGLRKKYVGVGMSFRFFELLIKSLHFLLLYYLNMKQNEATWNAFSITQLVFAFAKQSEGYLSFPLKRKIIKVKGRSSKD